MTNTRVTRDEALALLLGDAAPKGPRVLILRGLPGSGKSDFEAALRGRGVVVRTFCVNDYFTGRDGGYRFAAGDLTAAHTLCFRRMQTAVHAYRVAAAGPEQLTGTVFTGPDILVVNNTNLHRAEYTPYVMVARAATVEVVLIRFDVDPEVCAVRNTRGISAAAIKEMAARFEEPTSFDPHEYIIY